MRFFLYTWVVIHGLHECTTEHEQEISLEQEISRTHQHTKNIDTFWLEQGRSMQKEKQLCNFLSR